MQNYPDSEPSTNSVENTSLPALSKAEEEEVMQLAAVGFMPKEIAVAMEWPRDRRAMFCYLAEVPGSDVAQLIAAGRAVGRAEPQKKLQQAAAAGNIEAVNALQKIQAKNRYNELVSHMDDDEFNA